MVRQPDSSRGVLQNSQGAKHGLPLLANRPLQWWLDWINECLQSEDRHVYWCGVMLGSFLGRGDAKTREELLAEFNKGTCPYFVILGSLVVPSLSGVSVDDLSEDALSRLMLRTENIEIAIGTWPGGPVLGMLATEAFVEREILPRLADQNITSNEREWLLRVLDSAGRRHNRRYVVVKPT